MIPQAYVRLARPVTLNLARRSRVTPAVPVIVPHEFTALGLVVRVDLQRREIRGSLAPLPGSLLLYGPADFTAAAGDTAEQHAARVLEILGADPAPVLQSLIDGRAMPEPPPRVPREVANWRVKAVLHQRGLLTAAGAVLDALPEPQRTIARLAWDGDAKLARTSPAVAFIAASIGLVPSEIDQAFIAAEGLVI